MKTQFDFQGTKLKDFKASKLRDRNFYQVPTIEGAEYKQTGGRFFHFGFSEYAIYNEYSDNNSDIITDQQPATLPGPDYNLYLTETVVTTIIPNPDISVVGSSRTDVSRFDRITGEITGSPPSFSPDEGTYDSDTNFGPAGVPVGAYRTSSSKTRHSVEGLLNGSLGLFSTTVSSLSDPWPLTGASAEAINLMNSITGPDILQMEWGAQALAMYRGQINLERPTTGIGGIEIPGTGDPRYHLPASTIIVERRTAQQGRDLDFLLGGTAAYDYTPITGAGGSGSTVLASRAMVKSTSPVCVLYQVQKFGRTGWDAPLAKPVTQFSGGRHKHTILAIECAALAIDKFLPDQVADSAAARVYFKFDDPEANPDSTTGPIHKAPAVCYPPLP